MGAIGVSDPSSLDRDLGDGRPEVIVEACDGAWTVRTEVADLGAAAVCCMSGVGDGGYEVYVTREAGADRPARIEVVFLTQKRIEKLR